MTPIPGMRVLPDGWSDHHRPAAEGFLTGEAEAHEPGTGAVWPDPPTQGRKLWAGRCSAQFLSQSARPVIVVDSVQTIVTHRVSIPLTAPWLQPGVTITVVSNPDDPHLDGRTFTILAVETGTTNWTRDLLCQELNATIGGEAA